MKINKLKINNYGRLKDKEIELKDGINIIYGKNESGKSTLIRFITNSFYGISKTKKGKLYSDYERYKPWNGEEFSGTIDYELDNGEQYRIFRDFNKKNPKIYNGRTEDISNQFNVDKTNGNQFFYEQTKIDEDLFQSTLSINQQEVKLENKTQNMLIQKIANLVGTGDDNISLKRAIDRINRRQLDEIGSERSREKPINQINKMITELEQRREKLKDSVDIKYDIEEKSNDIKNEIEELEKAKKSLVEKKLETENDKIEKEKNEIRESLQKQNRKILILGVFIFVFVLINILQFIFIKNRIFNFIFILTVATVLIFYYLYRKNKKNKTEKNKNIQKEKDSSLKTINFELEKLNNKLSDKKIEFHKLEIDRTNLEPKLEQLSQLEEDLVNNKEQKVNLKKLNLSMNLAKEILEESYNEMKNSVTPKFTKNLSRNIARITDNRYNKVIFNEDEGLVVELDNGDYINAEKLSVGTIDQLYLSLRLSMVDELSSEKVPIMLDESFSYYDEERLENILKFLSTEFKNRQIIIFTCTKREREILEKNNIQFTYIDM